MRKRGSRRIVAVAGTLAIGAAGGTHPQQRLWQPDERVLVSDGGTLFAIAAAPLHVYAASPSGILAFDPARRQWTLPIPLPVELIATRPSALAWDGASGTVWLGTEAGDVFTAVPQIGRWDRVTATLRGRVDAIVAWPAEAAVYILAGGEWSRAAGNSLFVDPVRASAVPPQVVSAARPVPADPYFQAARGTLGLDPGTRRWPLTGVAAGQEPGEYWVATGGGGMIRFDSRGRQREWFRYGLPGTGAGSVARLDGLLWFGGDGRSARGGVASADMQLGRWRQYDRGDGAPGGFVAEIVTAGGATWFGSSDGLFRLDRDGRDRAAWSRLTSHDGLASDQVRSLAAWSGILWVGTERGLTPLDPQGSADASVRFTGRRVSRLATHGDSLLIATDAGLWLIEAAGRSDALAAAPQPLQPAPPLRGRVTDVIDVSGRVFAVADGRIYDVGGTPAPIRDAALDRIGPALRLAGEDGRLWVAGPRGIAYREPADGTWEVFTVPQDIPGGPVVDVTPVGDDVWVATPVGAFRLRWR